MFFTGCGLTTPLDGTGDGRIHCFKPIGPIGPRGIELLQQFRAAENGRDGINDYEDDGLSNDEQELEDMDEDEPLYIE